MASHCAIPTFITHKPYSSMNAKLLSAGIVFISISGAALAQESSDTGRGARSSNPFLERKTPSTLVPGLIARGYLGGDNPPLKFPTPVIAIIGTSREFHETIRPLMENELRGSTSVGRIEFAASGFLMLAKDSQVSFEIGNMICNVDGKDFGVGKYTIKVKAGKHKIELIRRGWNDGLPQFNITNELTKQPILFHTGEELSRELARSIKVGGKTMKSKIVGTTNE